jgi:Ca-activated chloride channel family protein
MKQGSYEPPSVKSIPITNSERKAFLQNQQQKEQQQQEQQQQEQQQQEQQPQDQQQQEQQQQEQQQQPKNNSANNLPVKSLNKNYANKIIQKNQSQSNIVPDSVETIVNNQEKCKACTIL